MNSDRDYSGNIGAEAKPISELEFWKDLEENIYVLPKRLKNFILFEAEFPYYGKEIKRVYDYLLECGWTEEDAAKELVDQLLEFQRDTNKFTSPQDGVE